MPASELRTDVNVIAELPGRNRDNVVMAGANLDSVTADPGINDNGSGLAAILETALMMARITPQNTLRFAWWGAEEEGLIGSQAYVDDLSQSERDRIALYLNYDMVGWPNYIFMVYDADESTFRAPVPVPAGSTARDLGARTKNRRLANSRTGGLAAFTPSRRRTVGEAVTPGRGETRPGCGSGIIAAVVASRPLRAARGTVGWTQHACQRRSVHPSFEGIV